MSVAEVRRLFRYVLLRAPAPVDHVLGWSDGEDGTKPERGTFLTERASVDFETEIRRVVVEREGFRTAAEGASQAARDDVQARQAKLDKMLRLVALTTDSDLDETDFEREIQPLKQDLKAAKRRLAECEALATSRKDAWSALNNSPRNPNLATTWEAATAEERKILLDYWVLDVWVFVEPISERNART